MPPRTGPRRRRRVKSAPPLLPRHFTIVRADETTDPVFVLSIELQDRCLVLRNQAGAIEQIVAAGQWREVRPAVIGDIPYADEADNDRIDSMSREEATLTPPAEVIRGAGHRPDYLTPPNPAVYSGTDERPAEETDEAAREQARFVPSSPEEAQRVLREIHRRLAPDYQDNPVVTNGTDPPDPPNPPGPKE